MLDDRILNFFNKNEFGKFIIDSNIFTDEELLFLLPNSKKHMLGYPTQRYVGKKNKTKSKVKRLRRILYPRMLNLIQSFIEERKQLNFVDIRDINMGELV